MTVKVLVCDQVEMEMLHLGAGFEVDYEPGITREDLVKTIAPYQALIVRSRTKVDRQVLDAAKSLKLVARPGTGLDTIDVEYAKKKGVTVVNSPESLVEAVAEHVIGLTLAMSRHLTTADQTTRGGRWEKNALVGTELKGKAIGIVGFGRIGQRVGALARAFGMQVIAYDPLEIPAHVVEGLGAWMVDIDTLFTSSDYITLHVPLTEETKHFVGAKRLGLMKKTSFLVNTSRGGVVDEAALAKALEDGAIAGAALDVFEQEPPQGAILSAPNSILTPHIGGQTSEAQVDAISVVGEKIRAFFGGK
jgi:D-3-phosphoglycerate dehydrogenase / 2-oxoglutarate reductase